jgi:hypothetical protein
MTGAAELAGGRYERDVAALDLFLQDAIHLVGADGSPLIEGRSLIYRFAAAAPFWAGVLAEVPSVSAGTLRHAAEKIVRHFDDRGAIRDGVLTMGWHDEWRPLAQSYSGPGSPYWASKGLLGLALPADHPVWAAPAEPLPAEGPDFARAIAAPGWAVSSGDGIVRIANHGTDHAHADSLVADSPLYARLGYSTATSPLLDERGWREPLEQSIALVDGSGRATHRAAMELVDTRVVDGAAVGISTWRAHTIDFDRDQVHHGSGLAGDAEILGRITAVTISRGTHEIRLARVDDASEGLRIRWGGWPVAGTETAATGSAATAPGVTSRIRPLGRTADARIERREDASPLGSATAVPVLEEHLAPGWLAAELVLTTGTPVDAGLSIDRDAAVVTWPDGHTTHVPLP